MLLRQVHLCGHVELDALAGARYGSGCLGVSSPEIPERGRSNADRVNAAVSGGRSYTPPPTLKAGGR